MSQAEIKTKLTADGSELSRAFDQGMTKASSFRTQVGNLGKAIGAAFTVQAAVNGLRSLAAAQVEYQRAMQATESEMESFRVDMENLNERLANATKNEGSSGFEGILLDLEQKRRAIDQASRQLRQREDLGGLAGVFKSLGDDWQKFSNNVEKTADESKLYELSKAAHDLSQNIVRAEQAQREFNKAAEEAATRNARNIISSGQYDAAFSAAFSGKDPEKMREFLKDAKLDASLLEAASSLATGKEAEDIARKLVSAKELVLRIESDILAAEKMKTEEAKRQAELAGKAADEAERIASNAYESNFEVQSRRTQAQNLLMGFLPEQRFSNLRRMGANELGSGVANRDNPAAIADKIIDKTGAKVGEVVVAVKDMARTVAEMWGRF